MQNKKETTQNFDSIKKKDSTFSTIDDEILKLNSLELLNSILKDKTTGRNIVWGTDDYEELGDKYQKDREISPRLITGNRSNIIKNRAAKNSDKQIERTWERAEVFTPLWVCNKMNNYVDEIWFGKQSPFNKNEKPTSKKIPFANASGWEKYVESNRMEITCGEAPYLATRYDANDGEPIRLKKRMGLLDRKMRIINENVFLEDDWIKWTYEAFQSLYGYEFQGDNILIARINMLLSFEEYLYDRWHREPTKDEYKKIINIIVWNIWQMDGLTATIPYAEPIPEHEQLMLLDFCGENEANHRKKQSVCLIYDWKKNISFKYTELLGGNSKKMKIDFIVGNPPFGEDVSITESKNGQKPSTNIFQFFQMQVDEIANKASVLIYPGDRWIHRSGKGKGMRDFGLYQINDIHLARLDYYPISKEVFNSVNIPGGISIVYKKYDKVCQGFEYRYIKNGIETITNVDNPGQSLLVLNPDDEEIMTKIDTFVSNNNLDYLNAHIYPRSLYGIESNFIENNPQEANEYTDGAAFDTSKEVKLLTNHKAGKSGRARWYIVNKNIIKKDAQDYIGQWQVVVSSASGGGQKRDNQLQIIDNHSAFGRVRVALFSSPSENQAKNFYNYVNSYVIRFAFLMADESLTTLGKRVPNLSDYSDSNTLIDFNNDIDKQLIKLLDLEEEWLYIKNRVDGIRNKQHAKD